MVNIFENNYSSLNQVAGTGDAYRKINFRCNRKVSFIANDSPGNTLLISFDYPVGSSRDITLLAGEVLNDLEISCAELYAQGVGGPVPFRAVGW